MTCFQFLLFLGVAGIAGGVGQALAGYSRGGCFASVALGFVGAVLGSWLGRLLHLPDLLVLQFGSEAFPVIWSVIGSALLVTLLGALSRPRC
jgi:uncharacterized membrane protein YeaQ/YmgE (transglycosylase-associated protein family)